MFAGARASENGAYSMVEIAPSPGVEGASMSLYGWGRARYQMTLIM